MVDINFKVVAEEMQKHLDEMVNNSIRLFKAKIDTKKLWDLYINSYTPEENPIYKTNREYECNTCKSFIERFGNVVSIKDNKLDTIWNFISYSPTINRIIKVLDEYVRSSTEIENVFLIDERFSMGRHHDNCYETEEDGTPKVYTFYHFYLKTPRIALLRDDVNSSLSLYKSGKEVFERALKEFNIYAVDTVLELIEANNLYRGAENKNVITFFKKIKEKYDMLDNDYDRELFMWESSVKYGSVVRIRNTAIGTLIDDISNGKDVEDAVTLYEKMVAPSNYKRPKAIYTQKMLNDAKEQITKLGYLNSLNRRFAQLEDISINNVLYANRNVKNKILNNSSIDNLFEDMKNELPIDIKKYEHCKKITLDEFINNIIPSSNNLNLLYTNNLSKNMVSLIAPKDKSSKSLFKWNNGFSWAYTGNMTDSVLKKNVEKAGGKIDGVLRFSIQWNDDPNSWNKNDEDAHCITPDGIEIYYGNKLDRKTRGNLDIDIINPEEGVPAVENITFPTTDTMSSGIYRFFVNCFTSRCGRGGFRAEIEYNGEIHSYNYSANMKQSENVKVADVIYDKINNTFSIKEYINSDITSRKVWNINTNTFIPISVIMYSPNYWKGENNIGAKHLFIFLNECINDEQPNSFYNEFLNDDFKDYRKVMEALGSKAHVDYCDNQLSGVGFSLTQHGNFIIKVDEKESYVVEY